MFKKKRLRDLTINDVVKVCKKNNDCYSCPLLDICGIPFGSLSNKKLNEESKIWKLFVKLPIKNLK